MSGKQEVGRYRHGAPAGAGPRLRGPSRMSLVAVLVLVAVPAPAAAQDRLSISTLEDRYSASRAEYDVAVSSAMAQRRHWGEWVTAWDQADRAGDEEAARAALDTVLAASRELDRLEERVVELREAANEARLALLDALTNRTRELTARFASAGSPTETRDIESLLQDVANQQRTLQNEVLPLDPVSALVSSSIIADPRDGPLQLRAKVGLLERQIQEVDSVVAEVDGRLGDLEARRRVEQTGGDFIAGLDRFGETRPLTGQRTPPSAGQEGIPTDSIALQRPLTVEEQILHLQALKNRLLGHRESLSRQAEGIHERIRKITQ